MPNPNIRLPFKVFKGLTLMLVLLGLLNRPTFLYAIKPAGRNTQPGISRVVPSAQLALVNPLMGTDSKPDLSNGNTYPAVGLPWGMNLWTAQTNHMGNGWAYTYAADKIYGFKQTHQPSPWMNDYASFSIMPNTGHMRINQDKRASWFSHKTETATPYYYSVYLADEDVTAEFTPTDRGAGFRFTYPKADSSFVVIDGLNRGSHIQVLPKQGKIIGYTTRYSAGKLPGTFKNWFVIYTDAPIAVTQLFDGEKRVPGLTFTGDHAQAIIGFKTKKGQVVNLRTATSYLSLEQAELNYKREVRGKDFDDMKAAAIDQWNKVLGAVEVQGGTQQQQATFYSCLYRMVFFPTKMYEVDARDEIVHYSPYTGKQEPGYFFAGTGFWDTFRALYPFLNLVYPTVNAQMQQGLANCYKEGGWLPEWSSPGWSNIMIGQNSASVVADAYLKGIRGQDMQALWAAVTKGANAQGPIEAVGRHGAQYYTTLGYVPYDVNVGENAAKTLEYAYDDYCIYRLGKALGKPDSETAIYLKRAYNYRNLFDKATGLMRPRLKDGHFIKNFSPFKWGDAFTEGNSWHYTWSVFQDVEGLKQLMGGNKAFIAKLDSVFTLPPVFDESAYGGVIHEIREMQIAGMGQYAHGNQPIQHMAYLYDYTTQPYKTQYWVRQVMDRLYKPTPDGYCGDEDNGQTSAWYVFSALGFYPVTPASNQYAIGAPLFTKAIIHLQNGREVIINAPANSARNYYVGSISVNGMPYTKNWLSHGTLQQGADITFNMQAKPDTRTVGAESYPFSLTPAK